LSNESVSFSASSTPSGNEKTFNQKVYFESRKPGKYHASIVKIQGTLLRSTTSYIGFLLISNSRGLKNLPCVFMLTLHPLSL